MTKRPKCKTRGCRHKAAAKQSIKAYGYCGGCYALRWFVGALP